MVINIYEYLVSYFAYLSLGRNFNEGALIVYGLLQNRSLEMNNLQHEHTTKLILEDL